jgi:diguanylate cyclase (GGDEF)-like protein
VNAEPRASVLIVDDEPANIHVLAAALQDSCELRFATDGDSALRLVAEAPPDLVLLDVLMPGLDGFAVLRRLKDHAATRQVPVIFVTAMSEIDDEERGLTLGAVDYITKPISPAIVRARVRTHLQLKQQRDLLERHAFLDGLTGIANRRRFDEVLEQRWRAAQRSGSGLSVLLVDIDYFKQYNDHYGHGPGDDCLRRVATAVARTFSRGDDLAARYGGEEFALVLAGGDGAAQAQRLLGCIAELAIPHRQSPLHGRVTVSAGAYAVQPLPQFDHRQAVESADRLLYQAKQGGRNRCVVYDERRGSRQVVTG